MKHSRLLAKALTSIILAGVLTLAPALSAIPGTGTAVTVAAKTKTKISVSKLTLDQGRSKALSVKNGKKAVKGVKWSTANKNVATVNKSGKVTAVGNGSTKIRAKAGKSTYTCTVTVRGLNKASLSLTAGKSADLSLGKLTKAQSKGKITWKSSNSKVASVRKISKTKYRVTAKKAGTAKITAKVGKTSYTCTVKVKAAKKSTAKKVTPTPAPKGTDSTASKAESTSPAAEASKSSGSTASGTESKGTGSAASEGTKAESTPEESSSAGSAASESGHVHNWVAQTKQVQTGTKTVVDQEAYDTTEKKYHAQCWCGFVYPNGKDDPDGEIMIAHMKEHHRKDESDEYFNDAVVEYIPVHHEAVTHEEPVYETVTTGYVCSICGATKTD